MSMAALRKIRPIKVTPPQKAVLWALADQADDAKFEAWPSMAALVEATCLSERAVRMAVAGLRDAGLLVTDVGGGRHKTTLYRLVLDAIPDKKTRQEMPGNEIEETRHVVQETRHLVPETRHVVPETRHDVPPNPQEPPLTLKNPKKEAREEISLPDWMPAEVWADWQKHRTSIRKPLTARAAELSLKQLSEFRGQGMSPKAVVEQSIAGGWTGLFPLKNQRAPQQPQRRNGFIALAERLAAEDRDDNNPFLLEPPHVH